MKTFNTLLIALLALGLIISSCKKDEPESTPTPTPTPTPTAKWPFAGITLFQDTVEQFKWIYETADDKLTKIIWDDPLSTENGEVHTITYDGTKLTKMEIKHIGGGKETVTVTYDGDKVKKISSKKDANTYSTDVELEYDADGKIDQLNRTRNTNGSIQNLGIWSFTYDGNGNVSSYTMQGNTTYNIKYDDKANPAYNSNEMLIVTAGFISHYQPYFWGPMPIVLALSKNNVIEATSGTNNTRTVSYNTDSNGNLQSVDETWAIGSTTNTYSWKITK